MNSPRRGRSRKRKESDIIKRRIFLTALVLIAILLVFAAVFSLVRKHLSDRVEYPEGSHAWWDFGQSETVGSFPESLPEGTAEVGAGPEDKKETGTKEASEAQASDSPVISRGEPSERLFQKLLEEFKTPVDSTETPDCGYSLDADDYADTGGTAQGLLTVDPGIPEDFVPLADISLPDPVADTPSMYTYEEMLGDLAGLEALYGDLYLTEEPENGEPLMRMMSAGETYDGRKIMVIYVGDLQAAHNVMITGAIHAREYITADLVMKQLGMLLEGVRANAAFDNRPLSEWLKEVCFTFVPMCNPDGVSISQYGLDGLSDPILKANVRAAYENDLAAGKADASEGFDYFTKRWKANARGVNLNENFNALWERIPGGMSKEDLVQLSASEDRRERTPGEETGLNSVGVAAYMSGGGFKGEAPCSEVETKILTILADQRHYEAAVHYHAMGEVLYWDICNNKLREHARDLSNQIMGLTGYTKKISDDGGGYKDYFHLKKDPAASLTVEVGTTAAPVDPAAMPVIWEQNIMVPYWTMKWAKEKGK